MSAFFGVSPHRTITLTFRSLATKRTRRDAQDDDDDDGAASAMVLALKIRHVSGQRHTVILPAPLAGDGTQLRGGKGDCSRSNRRRRELVPGSFYRLLAETLQRNRPPGDTAAAKQGCRDGGSGVIPLSAWLQRATTVVAVDGERMEQRSGGLNDGSVLCF